MQSNGPRQFQLRRELSNLTQNDLSVTQYFTKMKTIWDELSQFRPSCVCSQCSCGGVLRLCSYFETEFVLSFLMGLNDSLNNTRSQILLLDPLPSIHRVFAMMVQEEHQRSLNSLASAPGNMLTLATRFENPNARFDPSNQAKKSSFMPGNQFKKKDRPMCSHCGLLGHTIDQCFKIHGYPLDTSQDLAIPDLAMQIRPQLLQTMTTTPLLLATYSRTSALHSVRTW